MLYDQSNARMDPPLLYGFPFDHMYSYCMNDLVDETRGTTLILSSLKHTVFIYLFIYG